MKKAAGIALFFYCTLLATLIAISSFTSGVQMKTTVPFAILFIPVPLYFLSHLTGAIIHPKQTSLVQVHIEKSGLFGIVVLLVILVGAGAFSVMAYQNTAVVSPLSETPAQVLFPKWTKETTRAGSLK